MFYSKVNFKLNLQTANLDKDHVSVVSSPVCTDNAMGFEHWYSQLVLKISISKDIGRRCLAIEYSFAGVTV